jgi:hypothetical protein
VQYGTEKRFKKRLSKKTQQQQAGVLKCIAQVASDPFGVRGLHTKKIGVINGQDVYYSRVSSGDRVTFHFAEDGTLVFRNHCFKHAVLRSP